MWSVLYKAVYCCMIAWLCWDSVASGEYRYLVGASTGVARQPIDALLIVAFASWYLWNVWGDQWHLSLSAIGADSFTLLLLLHDDADISVGWFHAHIKVRLWLQLMKVYVNAGWISADVSVLPVVHWFIGTEAYCEIVLKFSGSYTSRLLVLNESWCECLLDISCCDNEL